TGSAALRRPLRARRQGAHRANHLRPPGEDGVPAALPLRAGPPDRRLRASAQVLQARRGLAITYRRRLGACHALAVERCVEDLIDRVDEDEVELAFRLARKVGQIGLVLAGKDDALQPRALRRE